MGTDDWRSAGRGLHHIGYWTDDLEAAMRTATAVLGVGPFRVIEHVDLGRFRFRGEPALLDHTAAFAQWGPVLIELDLVHDVAPEQLRDALRVDPGTVSHVAWITDDMGAESAHLADAGCALLTTSSGGAVANWFAGGSLFAHPIEVHQPPQQVLDFWESVRRADL